MDNKKILKVCGNGSYATTVANRVVGDKDKDGVANVLDCQPNNPNKQGWIHDLASYAKERVKEKVADAKQAPGRYVKEKVESYAQEKAIRDKAKEKANQAYFEERTKVIERQEIAKAKARASQPSGFFASLGSVQNNQAQANQVLKRRKVTTYKKVGKNYIAQTRYVKVKPKIQQTKTSSGFGLPTLDGLNSFTMGNAPKQKKQNNGGILNFRI